MIRVVVSGLGKMGREMLGGLSREDDIEPVGVLTRSLREEVFSLPDGSGRLIPCSTEASLLERLQPDVLIDFSNHTWTAAVAPAAVRAGARPIIGTTGLPADLIAELERECAAARLGGVVASNFALGAVLLSHLARVAAPFFESAEIIELHHDQKTDAPSGTALSIVDAMIAARDGRLFSYAPTTRQSIPGTRGGAQGGVGVHSVRLPGLVAHHEVIFGGMGQTLTLRHDSTSRESFLPGVLLATREVMNRESLVLGLDRLMGLDP